MEHIRSQRFLLARERGKGMPDAIVGTLREWALRFVQNKDLLTRKITSIDKDADGWDFVVNTTEGKRLVRVVPDLASLKDDLARIHDEPVWVVTLNTRQNVDALVQLWPDLITRPKLAVVFVNPSSMDKWMLVPHVHEKVTERKALKTGLMSMFSMVEEHLD